MGLISTYNILSNASYDSNLIQISGSTFKLKLQENNVDFTEDFENDTGFTYNSLYAEFISGLVRHVDKRPINAIFYASYTNGKDASWCNGTLTGTLGGSASVQDGYLNVANGYEEFPINNFTSMSGNAGCIRKRISFDYSGAAPAIQYLIQTSPNSANRVYLVHNSTFIQCYITNGASVTVYSMTFSWTPTQDVIYNFEVNWNSSHAYIFINGQLKDSDTGTLEIGEPSLFRIGGGTNTAFKVYDITVFNTLQHSENYVPDWSTFFETAYLGSSIVLPEMEYVGDGSIKLFNSLSMIYTGEPRILLEIGRSGDKLYWNGSSWGISNGDYTQATDPATFLANCTTLPVDGEKYGQFTIITPDSNTLTSISELTANMRIEQYSITNPKLTFTDSFTAEALLTFLSNFTFSGNDNVTFTIKKDNVERYYNSGWMVSNGTYSQSNTLTEIQNNLSTFFTDSDLGAHISVNVFLHSENGVSSPDLTDIIITYDFVEIDIDSIDTTIVYGFINDYQTGPKENKTVTAILNKRQVQYKNNVIYKRELFSTLSRSNGYWELALPDTENMTDGAKYNFNIDGIGYIRKVPSKDTYPSRIFWQLSN
jgi:hypothetical protein